VSSKDLVFQQDPLGVIQKSLSILFSKSFAALRADLSKQEFNFTISTFSSQPFFKNISAFFLKLQKTQYFQENGAFETVLL
jgi:hypothetical protein